MSTSQKIRRVSSYWYKVPWCVPAWGLPEFACTVQCTLTGAVRRGSHPDRFAESVKRILGRRFAIPAGRGRDAIALALRALCVGPGDEVVLPSYVCRSVADAVLQSGARPAFADVDESLHLSVDSVEAALTRRTRCVIVPHLFGNTAPIEKIEALLRSRGIALIDDAAQSFGARRGGKPVGSYGQFGIVCGGPGKSLAAARGAVLLMDDSELYRRACCVELPIESASTVLERTTSFWAWRRFRKYTLPVKMILEHLFGEREEDGSSMSGLSNLEAALLGTQLEKLEENRRERVRNASLLVSVLEPLGWKLISGLGPEAMPLKLVLLLPPSGPPMLSVIHEMGWAGLECQVGYSPCHLTTGNPDHPPVPVTESIYARVLCIPIESRLRDTGRLRRLVGSLAVQPAGVGL